MTSVAPLGLADLEPFGIGGRRRCYIHPLEPAKCVKVLRQDDRRTIRLQSKRRIVPARWRREYDNNAHEQQVLEQLERRLGDIYDRHLPRCYGTVATDLGPGLVLDLVRDRDGRISRSLRELISTGYPAAAFRPAFDELAEFLVEHTVLTRALLDHNIVTQERDDGSWRMVLIDGLGDPAWLPLARWFRGLGRNKMRRRVAVAWPRIEAFASRGGVTPELIESSSWGQGFLNHRDGE